MQNNFKEACRIFWMVKGHLNAADHVILDCYDGYFKRIWYNNESYVHEEGFEEAWENKYGSQKNNGSKCRRSELSRKPITQRTSQTISTKLIPDTQIA